MWSTLCMKSRNQSLISEWLARSQKVPLTIFAGFSDASEHPPCRYQDSATAAIANIDDQKVCFCHEGVLSLDQLLPHRSRIHHLDISFHSFDPDWDDDRQGSEPMLLSHRFFREPLPNLQCLYFCATHVKHNRYTIPVPASLFAGELPSLKELKYLGVTGGLTETAKNLVSCEIGRWPGAVWLTTFSQEELETLFGNNNNVRSLALNDCEFLTPDQRFTTTAPMVNLKFLRIHCPLPGNLEAILKSIHIPQFKSLDTVRLSIFSGLRAVATSASGLTFEFLQSTGRDSNFYPLRHLGAEVTTLRLDQEIPLHGLCHPPGLYDFFRTLDSVRVLEFDGAIPSVKTVVHSVLFKTRVFPRLKVIRVVVCWDDFEDTLELLAGASKLRMDKGNPFAVIEPVSAEGDDEGGLGQELRAEWEKRYEAEGIQDLLFE